MPARIAWEIPSETARLRNFPPNHRAEALRRDAEHACLGQRVNCVSIGHMVVPAEELSEPLLEVGAGAEGRIEVAE